jgi:hypothetical protein
MTDDPTTDLYDVDMTGEPDSAFGDSPEAPATPERDDQGDGEAPYGYLKDGVTPRKKPGPSKGTRTGNAIPRVNRPTNNRPGKPGPKPKQSHGTDYRAGITGLLQIPSAMLGMLGQRDETFALDGAALSMHSPALAEALNDLAQDNIAVAAALDRILAVGPYGAILGALMPLAFQIAANHKLIPDAMAAGAGVYPRDAFRDMLIAQSQRG